MDASTPYLYKAVTSGQTLLIEAVRRRPYCGVLLEKAHRGVLDLFYQVFGRGTMRDGEGREIDFHNCVILMTPNLDSALIKVIWPQLAGHFQPAPLARLQKLVDHPLEAAALAANLPPEKIQPGTFQNLFRAASANARRAGTAAQVRPVKASIALSAS